MLFSDCDICYADILAAAIDCSSISTWQQCIQDILGAESPCIACVCEDQISNTFYTVVDALKANYRIADNSVDNGKSL